MAKDLINKTGKSAQPAKSSSSADIANFLQAANSVSKPADSGRGLVFALDATMSRQATWDQAQQIQAEMFDSVGNTGGLDVQLVYFRGFGECRASRWVSDTTSLRNLMTGIECRGGQTQIGKVLTHARKEAGKHKEQKPGQPKVGALVFIGDAMEENPDDLCNRAGELGLLGVPCFMFQEGHDSSAEPTFREIARLTKGAYLKFGPGSAARLAELLKAVASYVSGGRAALEANSSRSARLLLEQLK